MMTRSAKTTLLTWAAFCGTSILQAAYYYPKLPDTVASHFNGAGQADSWMSKSVFLSVSIIVTSMAGLVFFAISLAMGSLPASCINLPNKDYWMAPERKDKTLAWLGSFGWWMATGTMALFLAVFQLAITANLRDDQNIGRGVWWPLGIYTVAILAMVVQLYRRFRKPNKSNAPT